MAHPVPHLLIVDGSAATRRLIAMVCAQLGIRVSEVASALEAIDALAAQPFDGMIANVDLPHFSGRNLLAWVRDMHDPELWVLMVAHDDDRDAQSACMQLGANACRCMPPNLGALRAVISEGVTHVQTRRERQAWRAAGTARAGVARSPA